MTTKELVRYALIGFAIGVITSPVWLYVNDALPDFALQHSAPIAVLIGAK